MKIKELCLALGAEIETKGDEEREVERVTAGDLLSFVMGTSLAGAVWITIQAHLNVAAVAVLKDIPMIVIAAGRRAPKDLIDRCTEENICVVSVKETLYGACCKMSALGFSE